MPADQPYQLSPRKTTLDQTQAEAAACEAYRRAQASHAPLRKMSSRRSQRRHNLEGSHLAEARMKRNKSQGHFPSHKSNVTVQPKTRQVAVSSPGVNKLEPPANPPATLTQQSARVPRRVSSVTAQGSPTPRRKPVPSSSIASTPAISHVQQFSYEAEPGEKLSVLALAGDRAEFHTSPAEPVDRSSLPVLRHAHSSPVQPTKLHNRRSLLLGPIKKLRKRSSTVTGTQTWVRDNSVPPFNLAEHGYTPPPPTVDHDERYVVEQAQSSQGSKSRLFSVAVRSRIKQLIRRPSAPSGLPPQHVPAKQLHYASKESSLKSRLAPSHAQRAESIGTITDERSRVSSWTNSTGVHSGRSQSAFEGHDHVTEHGMLQRTASGHSLRHRASFFGRSVHNKLRKPSRTGDDSSRGSQGLYTALQHLIQSSRKTPSDEVAERAHEQSQHEAQEPTAVPQPPEHRHIVRGTRMSSTSRSSIRAVTPDLSRAHTSTMSPVAEACSPCHHYASSPGPRAAAVDTPGTLPQFHTVNTSPPAHQLNRRAIQAQNRWQDTLELGRSVYTDTEINPYELTAIERQLVGWHTAPKGTSDDTAQVDARVLNSALSPSIYSRTSNGTPQPENAIRTSITITGREVHSYQISPVKSARTFSGDHPVKVSSEWRRWLSGELKDFSDTLSLTHAGMPATEIQSAARTSSILPVDTCESTRSAPSSGSESSRPMDHGSHATTLNHKTRAGLGNRRQSSYMNERYPTIENSRTSSRQSGQSRITNSILSKSEVAKQPVSIQPTVEHNKTLADLVTTLRTQSALGSDGRTSLEADPAVEQAKGDIDLLDHATDMSRPQSNVELLARFRSSLSENARPLGIQRRNGNSIFVTGNDDTLRRISAGPYASDVMADTGLDRENTAPAKLTTELPALSSSEWLAGPATKRFDGQIASHSLSSNKWPSPGQQRATAWLKARHNAADVHHASAVL